MRHQRSISIGLIRTSLLFSIFAISSSTASSACPSSSSNSLDFGHCFNPDIVYGYGLDGSAQYGYAPANQDQFPHGFSPDIASVESYICNRLQGHHCHASSDAVQACNRAFWRYSGLTGQHAVDEWNAALGGGSSASLCTSDSVVITYTETTTTTTETVNATPTPPSQPPPPPSPPSPTILTITSTAVVTSTQTTTHSTLTETLVDTLTATTTGTSSTSTTLETIGDSTSVVSVTTTVVTSTTTTSTSAPTADHGGNPFTGNNLAAFGIADGFVPVTLLSLVLLLLLLN